MTSITSKYLTVSELEQSDPTKPIWALNGSAESDVGQPGEVHIGIPKINGSKIDDLYVPQTWLPTELTGQIPRAQLLASSEFRNAINKNLIVPISEQFAKEIMAQEGVDEENERLRDLRMVVKEATAARSIQQSGAEVINTMEIKEAMEESYQSAPKELDPSFLMFANTLDAKTDMETLNLIRARMKFTGKELEHLVDNLRDKPKTIAFIQERRKAVRKK